VAQIQAEWVNLSARFTSGWPWPEESWGLDPMYGASGWCRACGTPRHEQTGRLTIQGSTFPKAQVWMPNWRFDAVCVSAAIAEQLEGKFAVQLRPVEKPRVGETGAVQLLPAPTTQAWHRDEDLTRAVLARQSRFDGDRTGARCATCGVWRWLPVEESDVPTLALSLESSEDLIASPEWFGDGFKSFHHLAVRRPLAEFLQAASPRNWDIRELELI
jgi:hypothetical protein